MTVSFLFGWQSILVGLVLLIAMAAVFLLVLASGRGTRSDWQPFLDARSPASPGLAEDAQEATAPADTVSRQRPR